MQNKCIFTHIIMGSTRYVAKVCFMRSCYNTLYNLGYTNRFLQLLTWTLACGKVASSRLSWLVVHLKIFRLAKRVQNWIVYCSSACDFTIKNFEADCYIYFWLQGYASLWVMVVIVFVSNFLITYAFC